MGLKKIGLGLLMALMTLHASAQFTYGTTGLLHMPNAEMQKDATLVVGGNFLNKHNLPSDYWWGYDTFNYFVNITFFDRLEIAYVMTLVKGQKEIEYWPEVTWGKFVNQDRHFAASSEASSSSLLLPTPCFPLVLIPGRNRSSSR